jgi:lauroyl/myristoyl acyltransferase
MVGHRAKTKTTAKKLASKMRKKGLEASVFKKKKGYGVSVTKKRKGSKK